MSEYAGNDFFKTRSGIWQHDKIMGRVNEVFQTIQLLRSKPELNSKNRLENLKAVVSENFLATRAAHEALLPGPPIVLREIRILTANDSPRDDNGDWLRIYFEGSAVAEPPATKSREKDGPVAEQVETFADVWKFVRGENQWVLDEIELQNASHSSTLEFLDKVHDMQGRRGSGGFYRQ